jgi:hypothetical protein
MLQVFSMEKLMNECMDRIRSSERKCHEHKSNILNRGINQFNTRTIIWSTSAQDIVEWFIFEGIRTFAEFRGEKVGRELFLSTVHVNELVKCP